MINFLLSTEIIPLCLRTMEMGSELSKTVATFIVQKILLDDVRAAPWRRCGSGLSATRARQVGLSYICATAERCYAVGAVLGSMVQMLVRARARGACCRARADWPVACTARATVSTASQAHHPLLLALV